MTKQQILQCFLARLAEELESVTSAAKDSIAIATNEEHRAESKYDTFSLETSYLARGQAQRVEELTEARSRLKALAMEAPAACATVQLGALVRLEKHGGERQTLFIGPAGGGEEAVAGEETVVLATSRSPLVRALMGRRAGEDIAVMTGGETASFTILSVE